MALIRKIKIDNKFKKRKKNQGSYNKYNKSKMITINIYQEKRIKLNVKLVI